MTNMQRLVLILAFIFAVLLGVLVATTLVGGRGGTSPTPSPSPAASLAPTAGAATGPAASPSASASAAASPSASASPKPSPTPKAIPVASIQFVQLALDAGTDPAGLTRTITFTAQTGTVTVNLATQSGGNTRMCLYADGTQLGCRTAVSGALTGKIAKATAAMKLTLRGAASATPTVTVTVKFPAAKPRVSIANARFDGTAFPATNGLQVVTTPRAAGTYKVTAAWGGHPFLYEVDLIEQGGPGLKTVKATSPSTGTTQSFSVKPPHAWMIVLKNSETGNGITPMTAVFTWP
jgi:hypothetical protein